LQSTKAALHRFSALSFACQPKSADSINCHGLCDAANWLEQILQLTASKIVIHSRCTKRQDTYWQQY